MEVGFSPEAWSKILVPLAKTRTGLRMIASSKMRLFEDASRNFLNYDSSSSAETSILALIEFIVIITDAIASFSSIVQNCRLSEGSLLRYEDDDVELRDHAMTKPNKGDRTSHECLRRMKHFLLTAAYNLLTCSFGFLYRNCTTAYSSTTLEKSVVHSVFGHKVIGNLRREHTVCFKMTENGHY